MQEAVREGKRPASKKLPLSAAVKVSHPYATALSNTLGEL